MKTLPFAECTVSDYTFLSPASNEQGKAHTAIAFVPHYFFAGTRNGRKWWRVRRQAGLENIFGPWRGHIYYRKAKKIDKDERNFHCWAPNGAPKVCFAKKTCCKRFFFALIAKDIQKDFTKKYIRNIRIRFDFFFQMSVSGERDHWKEPSKYLETWELTWNGKTTCKVVLKDFFSKADHLEKNNNQEGTNWERVKEKRLVFIHSLVNLPVKPWQCESTCRSFAVLDSVLIRDRRASIIDVTMAIQNFLPTVHRTKSPTGHTVFSRHTKSQWHSLEHHGGHSLSVKRGHLTYPTEQYPEQYSNTDSWIDRWTFFSWSAPLALVPHCGVTWFSHIPQRWRATLEVKLSTLSLG